MPSRWRATTAGPPPYPLPDLAAWVRDARGALATFRMFGNWERDAGILQAQLSETYGGNRPAGQHDRDGQRRQRHPHHRGARLPHARPTRRRGGGRPGGHRPDRVAGTARSGVRGHHPARVLPRSDPVLAGHTPGGQVAPLYVARGIGSVGAPARMFCAPELAVFPPKKERARSWKRCATAGLPLATRSLLPGSRTRLSSRHVVDRRRYAHQHAGQPNRVERREGALLRHQELVAGLEPEIVQRAARVDGML